VRLRTRGAPVSAALALLLGLGLGIWSPAHARFTASLNGLLFFVADDGTSGLELWKSDGTETGTVRVKDIRPGPDGSNPTDLTVAGSTLFFVADDGVSGQELWTSDGTEDGTLRVKDIRTVPDVGGEIGSLPQDLTPMNGLLFFVANDGESGKELWKSDGTEAGTERVKDIRPGAPFGVPFGESVLGVANGTLFFMATDGFNDQLWTSDGTETGTALVRNVGVPGGFGSGLCGHFEKTFTAVGSTLFFVSRDDATGCELWKSDGTAAGTVRVKDIEAGAGGSSPRDLTNVNGTLFFTANSDELWTSDGTEEGTVQINLPGFTQVRRGSLAAVGSTVFFIGSGELWKSDGTEAGTARVKDINPGSGDSSFWVFPSKTAHDGKLFFAANDGASGFELWKSDGTEDGTVRVKDVRAGAGSSYPRALTPVNPLFFVADTQPVSAGGFEQLGGKELWKSDGTVAGTVRVKTLEQGYIRTGVLVFHKRLDAWYGSVSTVTTPVLDRLELTTHIPDFLGGSIVSTYPDPRVTSEIKDWVDTFDGFSWVFTPSEDLDAEQSQRDAFAAAVAGLGPGDLIFGPPVERGMVSYEVEGFDLSGDSLLVLAEVTYRELNATFVCPGPECLDHFLCYKAKATKGSICSTEAPPERVGAPCEAEQDCGGLTDETAWCVPNAFAKGLHVLLEDRFETKAFEVKKPVGLCAPADKNGEGRLDPATHLRRYQIKEAKRSCAETAPMNVGQACAAEADCGGAAGTRHCQATAKHEKQTSVQVDNQFGTVFLDTVKPDRLLVPAAKALEGPVAPPDPGTHGVDHVKCYKVKITPGSHRFTPIEGVAVADQFTGETPKRFDLKKPVRLCTPAKKNQEGIKNPTAHLLCYQAKPAKGEPKHTAVKGIFVSDQFGPQQLDTVKEDEFCVPSTMTVDGGE
jgi:ELWxxDGT repeat protein